MFSSHVKRKICDVSLSFLVAIPNEHNDTGSQKYLGYRRCNRISGNGKDRV